jgi:hypothetical protein
MNNEYKKKYMKYKAKYLNLLKKDFDLLKGGAHGDNIVRRFTVINNDGFNNNHGYSNQCMWLSIIDYLKITRNQIVSLETIRTIASRGNAPINNQITQFDSHTHQGSLRNVLNHYGLNITIYPQYIDTYGDIFINKNICIQTSNNLHPDNVFVVSYGAHFELITSIDGVNVYNDIRAAAEDNTFASKNDNVFKPNVNLNLGRRVTYRNNNTNNEEHVKDLLNIITMMNTTKDEIKLSIRRLESELQINEISRPTRNEDNELYEVIKESIKTRKTEIINEIETQQKNLKIINHDIQITTNELNKIILS